MSYCTSDDVSDDFKNIDFTQAGANMTVDKIDGYIAEHDALINSYIGNKYVTPVTAGDDALSLLKLFSRTLTRDRVRAVMEVKLILAKDIDQQVRRDESFTTKDVMTQLALIRDGEMALVGATPNSPSSGFYSRNNAANETPRFQKDRRQW